MQFNEWTEGEIILQSDAILLDNSAIPYPSIDNLGQSIPTEITDSVTACLSIAHADRNGKKITILSTEPATLEKIERNILLLLLHNKRVYVKHPAMIGGAIDENAQWEEGRLAFVKDKKTRSEKIVVVKEIEENISVLLDTIESVELERRDVHNELRSVIDIKHQVDSDIYNSFIVSQSKTLSALIRYLKNHLEKKGLVSKSSNLMTAEWGDSSVTLSEGEEQLLVALYSGVSSLEMDAVLEINVDELDQIYERLINLDVLKLLRIRREVELSTKGRTIVNQKMKTKDDVDGEPLY